ncbi:pyridoxamine 5'-phosphate oxidase [Albibacterium profundi]|uniref:Pyridoxine/pyridoxamine 5'-phosphate oxidase n=1 Tax=Albibacterium profundi TaxID=3134906 RepID=A0ABV5CA51_9SPHI
MKHPDSDKSPTVSELHTIRTDYIKSELHETQVNQDPIQQFITWFNEALHSEVMEPNAMTLATATADGQPNARTVLLKHIDDRGFVFFTNYDSQKGKEIAENKKVSLLFFWPELERQVRVQGTVEKISFEESETYFHSRPRGSQLGALASHQSVRIDSREVIEEKLTELEDKYKDSEVPLPDYWGGYCVKPLQLEFWQGGAKRLHDRIVYKNDTDKWEIFRISP